MKLLVGWGSLGRVDLLIEGLEFRSNNFLFLCYFVGAALGPLLTGIISPTVCKPLLFIVEVLLTGLCILLTAPVGRICVKNALLFPFCSVSKYNQKN